MTNTFAIQQPIHRPSVTQSLSKRTRTRLRNVIGIAIFVVASFASVGTSFDAALAKVTNKMRAAKHSGQFRLLNLYNTIKAKNPAFINAMNGATSGLASWYGGIFHGHKTAMGTTYNMYAMTAAHRSLPLGTWVKVTNEANGKSAVVQVTDRGPYVANRVMDLSYAAAQKLGYMNTGTTHISMEVLGRDYASTNEAPQSTDDTASVATVIPSSFSRVWTRSTNTVVDDSMNIFDAIASITTQATSALFA